MLLVALFYHRDGSAGPPLEECYGATLATYDPAMYHNNNGNFF
jgi:hypothetical protein